MLKNIRRGFFSSDESYSKLWLHRKKWIKEKKQVGSVVKNKAHPFVFLFLDLVHMILTWKSEALESFETLIELAQGLAA